MSSVQSPALDAVLTWLHDHPDVAEQVQALAEAQNGVMRVLDGLVPKSERRALRLACCDHLWCAIRSALAGAIHAPSPPGIAAEVVIGFRWREGRAHVPDVCVRAAAEAVWDACPVVTPGNRDDVLRRGLAILALLNCPDPDNHAAVTRAALREI